MLADRLGRIEPLSERERRAICGLWRGVSEHKPRSSLPKAKDAGFVVDGWACRLHLGEGRRQIVQFLSSGDCHMSLRGAAVAGLSTACLTRVQFIDVSELIEAPGDYPGVQRLVLAAERRNSEHLIAHVLRLSGDARRALAHLLLELEHRATAPDADAGGWFHLPIGQRQLSSILCFSTVHLNHTLARFREEGLVEIRPRAMRVLDREALTRLARS